MKPGQQVHLPTLARAFLYFSWWDVLQFLKVLFFHNQASKQASKQAINQSITDELVNNARVENN